MRISTPDLRLWAIQFLVLGLFTAYASSDIFFGDTSRDVVEAIPMPQSSAISYNYERFREVQEACGAVLSAASKLVLDRDAAWSLQNELSFTSGYWNQSSTDSKPLLALGKSMPESVYHRVSFSLIDVDIKRQQSPVAVNVSGTLSLSVQTGSYRNGTYSVADPNAVSVGYSSTSVEISVEGIYTETTAVGGFQRVMCLLGKTMSSNSSFASGDNTNSPSFLQDDKLLLLLRYPKTLTLTTRAIHGELTSLHQRASRRYFDKIILRSQLGAYSVYQFGAADNIISKACTPYPYPDQTLKSDNSKIYKGRGLCRLLYHYARGDFVVVPNWKCKSTDQYCRKLGPFYSNREVNETDGGFQNVRLLMQDVRCEVIPNSNGSSARVSAYFQAIRSSSLYNAQQNLGTDGTTLSVEGKWDSSTGQLCMAGCIRPGEENCNSRVCLYNSFSFSISKRNIITGSISPVDEGATTFFPLSFERAVSSGELQYLNLRNHNFSYEYTKFKQAVAFLERSEPFEFGAFIKKALLKYPRKLDRYSEDQGLYALADDLTLDTVVTPDSLADSRSERAYMRLGIFTIGSFVRGDRWMSNETMGYHINKPALTEGDLLLNISAALELSGETYKNVSMLSLEGIYDPFHGRLFLIACRDVRASWEILSGSGDLENGLDCLIEVKLEYPPTNMRWLVNQIAKISIQSQRTDDDPLYFSPIKLRTLPIIFRHQQEEFLSQKLVEGILQVSTFSIAVGCILSQLFYSGKEPGSVPYISLVMLGVQTFGYSIPLITGAEALFSARKHTSYGISQNLEKNQSSQLIDYLFKALVLAAFLLTLRLGQKVWKSRIRLARQTPSESDHAQVPDDKLVFLTCLAVHSVGFLAVLAMHITSSSLKSGQRERSTNPRGIREWHVELEEYAGLVQDFFLLPQVIGNFIWRTNCMPLRKAYYISITLVRILPHIYDYITSPVYNPYLPMEFEFANPTMNFYSRFDDIAIPTIAILLSAIIYLQQRRNQKKISQPFRLRHLNIFSFRSRTYEKLPTISETELVPSVNLAKD